MKAISIRYIKLNSLQAPLDNLLISTAPSLICWRGSASPACSIASPVSHNTAAPDGRQGKHLPPELSPTQFPSINQQLGLKKHSLLCLAPSCQRLSTLELAFFHILSLGMKKPEDSYRFPMWLLSLPPSSIMSSLVNKRDFVLALWFGVFNSGNEASWLTRWDLVSLTSIQETEEHYLYYSKDAGARDCQAKGTSGLTCGKHAHWVNVTAHAHSAVGRSSRSWLVNCSNGGNPAFAL